MSFPGLLQTGIAQSLGEAFDPRTGVLNMLAASQILFPKVQGWLVQGVDVLRWEFLPAGKHCVPSPWHSMVHLQVQGNFCFLVVKYSLDSLVVIFVKLMMSVVREVALLLQLLPGPELNPCFQPDFPPG